MYENWKLCVGGVGKQLNLMSDDKENKSDKKQLQMTYIPPSVFLTDIFTVKDINRVSQSLIIKNKLIYSTFYMMRSNVVSQAHNINILPLTP